MWKRQEGKAELSNSDMIHAIDMSKEKKPVTYRRFNFFVTLFGALFGIVIPQNKEFSEKGDKPIPEDIRGNKKEGDEPGTLAFY